MLAHQTVRPHHLAPGTRSQKSNSAQGKTMFAERVSEGLTAREQEVLELAGQGLSCKGIALALGISSSTVTWHLKNCYQKYGVGSREQALRQARLTAQILPIGTSVCACGRVHTLYGTAPVNAPEPRDSAAK